MLSEQFFYRNNLYGTVWNGWYKSGSKRPSTALTVVLGKTVKTHKCCLLLDRQTADPLVFVWLNISLQRKFHTEIFLAFNPGTSHSSSFSSNLRTNNGCKGSTQTSWLHFAKLVGHDGLGGSHMHPPPNLRTNTFLNPYDALVTNQNVNIA